MRTVILFDIDGTLVRTGGAGKAAVEAALVSRFRVREVRDGVPYSGRTDPAILSDVLRLHEIEPTPEHLAAFSQEYLSHLPGSLKSLGGQPCPGVRELIPLLKTPLGLLTGNVKRGAEEKLRHFDLWHHFPFGGFGDIHTNRDDVARTALAEARRHLGEVDAANIWIVGDTPLDVQCAKAIGARSVAVATGWNSYEELLTTGADLVLRDLADTNKLPGEWF